jgi:hypothetical protein
VLAGELLTNPVPPSPPPTTDRLRSTSLLFIALCVALFVALTAL